MQIPPEPFDDMDLVTDIFLGGEFEATTALAIWPTWEIEPGDILTNTRIFSKPSGGEGIIRRPTGGNPRREDGATQPALYAAGAVFRVELPEEHPEISVQRELYLQQVNTYLEWELGMNSDGVNMNSGSGHLTRYGKFYSPKDYFSGVPVDEPEDKEHGTARWYRPFDSPSSPRSIRDSIHDAIVRNDPISWDLDAAVQNIHHEYFRRQAIQQAQLDVWEILHAEWESDWDEHTQYGLSAEASKKIQLAKLIRNHEHSRAQKKNGTNARARQLADMVAGFRPDQLAAMERQQLLIWLLANVLRREIKLLDISDITEVISTGTKVICRVSTGYDKADLTMGLAATDYDDTNLIIDCSLSQAKAPLVIGMSSGGLTEQPGYYALTPDFETQRLNWRRLAEDGGNATIRNLLHAIYATEYAAQHDYILDDDTNCLSASAKANRVVADWLTLVKGISGLNYEQFQHALLSQDAAVNLHASQEPIFIRP